MIRWPLVMAAMALLSAAIAPPTSQPLATGPIAYYDGACSHCHGPYGSAYTDAFYTHTDLAKLKSTLKEMANGPGQSPIDGIDLDAQVAFHQAIIAKLPFLAWTAQDGLALSGEVTRKATVTATVNDAPITVNVKGATWRLTLAGPDDLKTLVLTATLGKTSVTWRPVDRPFSVPPKWPPNRT